MAAVPSFIELMASLGLDSDSKSPPALHITPTRSRSGSCSSASSGSSFRDKSPISPTFNLSSDSSRDLDNDRRHSCNRLRAARYTPYISTGTVTKQHSLSSKEDQERESKPTSPSSSPPRRRPSPLRFSKNGRDEPASTPISSYLRRKTPQNSPTVPTFTHRDSVERPETITLPSLFSL